MQGSIPAGSGYSRPELTNLHFPLNKAIVNANRSCGHGS